MIGIHSSLKGNRRIPLYESGLPGGGQRQFETERAADADLAGDKHPAAMYFFDYLFDQV